MLLLNSYQSIVRALLEGNSDHARAAQQSLVEARVASAGDNRLLPWAAEVEWNIVEHEATRALLSVMAGAMAAVPLPRRGMAPWDEATTEFAH